MGNFGRFAGLAGLLLLSSAVFAQDQGPVSPRVGNAQRGNDLLLFLGPRPAGGFSPLQQQALGRRVRCAAIRQQIQDELDIEAAGSVSLYTMSELRVEERENCTPISQGAGAQQATLPAPQPVPQPAQASTWQPPKLSSAPPPVTQATSPQPSHPVPIVSQATSSPTQHSMPPSAPQPQPHATGPAYTPAPDYPHDEMAAGHEGVVMVQLVMNPDGTVKAASIAKSSGFPALDTAALNAGRIWRIPAAAGRTIEVPLTFSAH
ncbi:MAG TPA: TonB family protein [Xanthomonadaceae bacterium]|jgi:TonB family protein|nr:TonB family protein [Xanthomonadaceae bacterium]